MMMRRHADWALNLTRGVPVGTQDLDALKALFARDLVKWETVIARQPLRPAVFSKQTPHGPVEAFLAHVVVHENWAEGLPALWKAGDRFDRACDTGGGFGGLAHASALGLAWAKGRRKCAETMLALGADPNHNQHACLPLASWPRSWARTDPSFLRMFTQHGATPFSPTGSYSKGPGDHLMASLLMRGQTSQALAMLAPLETLPGKFIEKPNTLWYPFFAGATHACGDARAGEAPASLLMDRLICLGLPVPDLKNVLVANPQLSGHERAIEPFIDLVERVLEKTPMIPGELTEHLTRIAKYPEKTRNAVEALLHHVALEASTQKPQAVIARPRL